METKKSYSEQLRDPRWQKKRLEIMDRDRFTCCYCGNDDRTLNVHHNSYKFGKNVWDYPNNNFVTLCEDCHKMITYYSKESTSILQQYAYLDAKSLFNLLQISSALYPIHVKILIDIANVMNTISEEIINNEIKPFFENDSYNPNKYEELFNTQLIERIKLFLKVN